MEYVVREREVEVLAPVDRGQFHALNKLWGFSDGTVPPGASVSEEHKEAAHHVARTCSFVAVARFRVYKDGTVRMISISPKRT